MTQSVYAQDRIFKKKAKHLVRTFLENYYRYLTPERGRNVSSFGRDYVEMGVQLGELVSKRMQKTNSFVEIASGLAFPSLTLVELGFKNGFAFDFEPEKIQDGRALTTQLSHPLNYRLIDFYLWRPSLLPGTFLIADKPKD